MLLITIMLWRTNAGREILVLGDPWIPEAMIKEYIPSLPPRAVFNVDKKTFFIYEPIILKRVVPPQF